jgi:hypothetical protein
VASKASRTKPSGRSASAPEDVGTFLASLDHPFKQEILAIRQVILSADPSITEEIKSHYLGCPTDMLASTSAAMV